MGKLLFWLLWPLIWLYSPLFRRVRVVIRSGDSIVVVKNWFGAGYWQLPGGGIKRGETVEQAAVRELVEELGIAASPRQMKLLFDDVRIVRQSGLLMRYHFLQLSLREKKPLIMSRELTDAQWVRRKDIASMQVATEVTVGLKQPESVIIHAAE